LIKEILSAPALTPAERQIVLRRLKYGPVLPRGESAGYVLKVIQEVIAQREVKKENQN